MKHSNLYWMIYHRYRKKYGKYIARTEILESSLYMISSATMLLRSVNNLIIANILDLRPRKNARSIAIG